MEIQKYIPNNDLMLKGALNTISRLSEIEMSSSQTAALKSYAAAGTIKMPDFVLRMSNANSQFFTQFKTHLEVHLGFNIGKTDSNTLFSHVRAVFTEIGKIYPDFGCMELFEAFDFCLVHNPQICKSYDRNEGASSFTSVYLATIIRYYIDNRHDFYKEVSDMMRMVKEVETIQEKNLQKLKIYRDSAQTIIHNIFCLKELDEFVNDSPQYIATLYKLLKDFGHNSENSLGVNGKTLKQNTWNESGKANTTENICKCQMKIIRYSLSELHDIFSDIWEIAENFGFKQEYEYDIKHFSEKEMEVSEMIEKYGKGIVNIFPLSVEEFTLPHTEKKGIGSILKEAFDLKRI